MQILIELSKDDWSILKPYSKKIGMDYIFEKQCIELPEHHGRLIDADKLERKIMYAEDKAYETWDELYDCVLEDIENAPTIIEGSDEE